MMVLAVFGLVGLVAGKIMEPPIELDYHNKVGIPMAARIKAHEHQHRARLRIAGGKLAFLGEYPFFGGLIITMTNGSQSVCGSTLLTNTRGVTAGHCWRTKYSQAREFMVVYGSIFLFSGGTRVTTSDVEVHEGYNMTSLQNDLAIIKHSWVNFNGRIHSIPLATGNGSYVGEWAQAVGFGRTGDSIIIPRDRFLSHVFVRVMTNAECEKTYGDAVTESTLCVATNGGRSTCYGDSGGPLVLDNHLVSIVLYGFVTDSTPCVATNGGRRTCSGDSGGPLVLDNHLIGITSFGHEQDCQQSNPTGFSRVTCFVDWITARLGPVRSARKTQTKPFSQPY